MSNTATRRPAKPVDDRRKGDLAAIHIAQKSLGMSDEDAQALKLSVTGNSSAGGMSPAQRRHYLAHLSQLQAIRAGKPRPLYTGPRRAVERAVDDGSDDRWSKARTLWSLLANVGEVRINTDDALTAYVKRQTGLDAWRFLNGHQINTVIESLKRWCLRVKVKFES